MCVPNVLGIQAIIQLKTLNINLMVMVLVEKLGIHPLGTIMFI